MVSNERIPLERTLRMSMNGPWGMGEAERFIRAVATVLVGAPANGSLCVVVEEIHREIHPHSGVVPTGLYNRQVQWRHAGTLALGTDPTKTKASEPSRILRTAWLANGARAQWDRIYGACREMRPQVKLSDADCVFNARNMMDTFGDPSGTLMFLDQIVGELEPLAQTLRAEAEAMLQRHP